MLENKDEGQCAVQTANKLSASKEEADDGPFEAAGPNFSNSPAPSLMLVAPENASTPADGGLTSQSHRRQQQRASETGAVDENTKEVIRSVLRRHGSRGMTCLEFQKAARLNVAELGFRFLVDFLKSVPDVVELRENPENGIPMCFPASLLEPGANGEKAKSQQGRRQPRNDARGGDTRNQRAAGVSEAPSDGHKTQEPYASKKGTINHNEQQDRTKTTVNTAAKTAMEQKHRHASWSRGRGILSRDALMVSQSVAGMDSSDVLGLALGSLQLANAPVHNGAVAEEKGTGVAVTAGDGTQHCEVSAPASNKAAQLTSHEEKRGGVQWHRTNRGHSANKNKRFPRHQNLEPFDARESDCGVDNPPSRGEKPEADSSSLINAQQELHSHDGEMRDDAPGNRQRPYARMRGRGFFSRRGRGRGGRTRVGADGDGPKRGDGGNDSVAAGETDDSTVVDANNEHPEPTAENFGETSTRGHHAHRGRGSRPYRGRGGRNYRRQRGEDPRKEEDAPRPPNHSCDKDSVPAEGDSMETDDRGEHAKTDGRSKMQLRPYGRHRAAAAAVAVDRQPASDNRLYQDEPGEDVTVIKPVNIRISLTKNATEEGWARNLSTQDLPPAAAN